MTFAVGSSSWSNCSRFGVISALVWVTPFAASRADLTFHQVGRQRRQPVMLAIRPTVFNRYVAAHKITSFTQTF